MNTEELVKILETQKNNLKALLEIVMSKQKILLNNQLKKLPHYIALEEKKLLGVQLTEEKRLQIMQTIFNKYNIKSQRYKLQILTKELDNILPENYLQNITDKEKEIKKLISQIVKINKQNLLLVEQSSQIISETVKAVIETSKKVFIDRKG